jgi:hypothetical protein
MGASSQLRLPHALRAAAPVPHKSSLRGIRRAGPETELWGKCVCALGAQQQASQQEAGENLKRVGLGNAMHNVEI